MEFKRDITCLRGTGNSAWLDLMEMDGFEQGLVAALKFD